MGDLYGLQQEEAEILLWRGLYLLENQIQSADDLIEYWRILGKK